MDPPPRGPDWTPITPQQGSLFHADGVDAPPTASCAKVVVVEDRDRRRGVHGEG